MRNIVQQKKLDTFLPGHGPKLTAKAAVKIVGATCNARRSLRNIGLKFWLAMQSSCWVLIFSKNVLTSQRKLNQFKSVIIKVNTHIHMIFSSLVRRVLKTNSMRRAVHYAINVDHFILRLLTAHRTDMTCESGTSQVQERHAHTHTHKHIYAAEKRKKYISLVGASKIKSLMKKKYFVHSKHGACVRVAYAYRLCVAPALRL